MQRWARLFGVLAAVSVLAGPAAADDSSDLRITHKFSWRRWVGETYVGFVYGSVSGSWRLGPLTAEGRSVDARYYRVQESRRDSTAFEKPVDEQTLVRFRLTPQGQMAEVGGSGAPVYRNYPAPLPAGTSVGAVWTGPGALSGDFLADGRFTVVPILVEYRRLADGDYLGTPVVQVAIQYALRYRTGQDASGDPDLAVLEGKRTGVAQYSASSGQLVFLRETVEQTARPVSGQPVKNLGFVYTTFDRIPALGTTDVARVFRDAIAGKAPAQPPPAPTPSAAPTAALPVSPAVRPEPVPQPAATAPSGAPTPARPAAPVAGPPSLASGDAPESAAAAQGLASGPAPIRLPAGAAADLAEVKVEADPRGVKLTLENLRFVADQAVLLPGEDRRLAAIAALLNSVPDRPVLVVGHTADLGKAAGQDQLSVDRALAVVGQLKKAGVAAGRILYQGRGGREPLVPNDTEAHRAQNRRVEVLLLDQ